MDFQRHDASDFFSKMRMERRKAQKPRIEKLRRDRINGSLEEIKRLVLEALNKDSSRYSKMEKADILEMTVQFLKGAQARKRLQIGLRSQAENTMEIRTEPKTSQIPGLKENPLLAGMSNDITPIPMLPPSMPPFVAPPMVTMGTQPAIVWLSCPSPPPSLAKEEKQTSHSSIKQSINIVESGNHLISRPCGITTVTSPSNVMFSVWRPW